MEEGDSTRLTVGIPLVGIERAAVPVRVSLSRAWRITEVIPSLSTVNLIPPVTFLKVMFVDLPLYTEMKRSSAKLS